MGKIPVRMARPLNVPQSLSRPHPPILIGGGGADESLPAGNDRLYGDGGTDSLDAADVAAAINAICALMRGEKADLTGVRLDLSRAVFDGPEVIGVISVFKGISRYEEAAKVAKQAVAERKTIRQVVLERGYVTAGKLTEEQLDRALDVLRMTRP